MNTIDYDYKAFKLVKQLYLGFDEARFRNNLYISVELSNCNHDGYDLLGYERGFIFHEYMMNRNREYRKKMYIKIYFVWGPELYDDVWIVELGCYGKKRVKEENVLKALTSFLKSKIKTSLVDSVNNLMDN
jgi:hypothetical protein